MKNKLISLLLLVSLVTSCKELTGASTGANDNIQDVIVSSRGLSRLGTELRGSGELVFTRSLGAVKSAKSFRLKFYLPEEDSSIEIITYATNRLTDGVGLKYSRIGNSLILTASGDGHAKEIADGLEDFNPNSELHFVLDVHNDHSTSHLLLWPFNSSDYYDPYEAILESDDFIVSDDERYFPEWDGVQGRGEFWGLRLHNAHVLNYEVAGPKFVH